MGGKTPGRRRTRKAGGGAREVIAEERGEPSKGSEEKEKGLGLPSEVGEKGHQNRPAHLQASSINGPPTITATTGVEVGEAVKEKGESSVKEALILRFTVRRRPAGREEELAPEVPAEAAVGDPSRGALGICNARNLLWGVGGRGWRGASTTP